MARTLLAAFFNIPERDSRIKKARPQLLIVGAGLVTVGFKKAEEESPLSDLKIPQQGSEHVLWTR